MRLTPAGDEAVRIERDRVGALVSPPSRGRKHVLFVHGHDALERQALAVVPGQGHGHAGGQGLAVGGPDRLAVRKLCIGADPAEFGIVGRLGPGRGEQHDLRALGVDGLVVVFQRDVIDARALQVD